MLALGDLCLRRRDGISGVVEHLAASTQFGGDICELWEVVVHLPGGLGVIDVHAGLELLFEDAGNDVSETHRIGMVIEHI